MLISCRLICDLGRDVLEYINVLKCSLVSPLLDRSKPYLRQNSWVRISVCRVRTSSVARLRSEHGSVSVQAEANQLQN